MCIQSILLEEFLRAKFTGKPGFLLALIGHVAVQMPFVFVVFIALWAEMTGLLPGQFNKIPKT